MPLATRELLLILRAQDDMSNILSRNGSAIRSLGADAIDSTSKLLGTGLALQTFGGWIRDAGLAAIEFGQESVDAYIEARKQAALTATQAQDLGITVEDALGVVNDLGQQYGTSLEGLHKGLFEILSTVEVTSLEEAKDILEDMALGAIATGSSVGDLAGVTLGTLNAFNLGAEGTLDVLDAVQRAAEQGTQSVVEFAPAFATVIPSAQAFQQSYQDAFGAVAFITKETNLSAAEAGTAVARAFDLFTKSKVRRELKAIGIDVSDLSGDFRGILPIMKDLDDALGGLTEEARRTALEDIFGPNVRAFRFLNPAIKDFESFAAVLGEVNQGVDELSGILGAYALTSEEAYVKSQLLINQWDIFKQEVGKALLPVWDALVDVALELLDAWNQLDPVLREHIIQFVAIAGAVAVIVGGVAAFIGSIKIGLAVLGFLNIGLGEIIGVGGLVSGAFALIAGAAILVWQNWDKIKQYVGPVIDWLQEKLDLLILGIDAFKSAFSGEGITSGGFIGFMEQLGVKADEVRQKVKDFWDILFNGMDPKSVGGKPFQDIGTVGSEIFKLFGDDFILGGKAATREDGVSSTIELIALRTREAWQEASSVFEDVRLGFRDFWDVLTGGPGNVEGGPGSDVSRSGIVTFMEDTAGLIRDSWGELKPALSEIGLGLRQFVKVLLGGTQAGPMMNFGRGSTFVIIMEELAKIIRDVLIPALQEGWDMFKDFLTWFIEELGPGISKVAGTFIDEIGNIWEEVGPTILALETDFRVFFGLLVALFEALSPIIVPILKGLVDAFVVAWNSIAEIVSSALIIISNIIQFIMNLIQGDWDEAWENIKTIGREAWDILVATFSGVVLIIWNIMRGLILAIWGAFLQIVSLFSGLKDRILSALSGIGWWLWNAGKALVRGFINGISSMAQDIRDASKNIGYVAKNAVKAALGIRSPSKIFYEFGQLSMLGLYQGLDTGWQDVNKYISKIDPSSLTMGNVNLNPSGNRRNKTEMLLQRIADILEEQESGIKVQGDLVMEDKNGNGSNELNSWDMIRIAGV